MKNIRKEIRPIYLMPVAILAISTAAIFIRFAQRSLPSITIATYRMLLASILILPFSAKKAVKEFRGASIKSVVLLLLSGFLLAVHFASWIVSLSLTNVISSVVLVTTTPIWVSMITPIFIKENISKKFWVGLAVAFVGILIVSGVTMFNNHQAISDSISSADSADKFLGNSLALLGAFCAAGYVIIGRLIRKGLSTSTYIVSVYSAAAMFLVIFTVIFTKESLKIPSDDLIWLILLAVIPQLIGHSLIIRLLGYLPAHTVSISLLGEPIGSTLLAIIFLNEIPAASEVIGAVVILAGILIAIIGKDSGSGQAQETC